MSHLLPSLSATLSAAARATTSKVTLEALSLAQRTPTYHSRSFSCSRSRRTQRRDGEDHSTSTSAKIRSLMRSTAQPVALITTFLPSTQGEEAKHIHAATLSSFTSVSLEPDLVCFALRTPSRLADALEAHVEERPRGGEGKRGVDCVVNMLAAGQARLAAAYAVPGTPPLAYPPTGREKAGEHPLREVGLVEGVCGEVPWVKGSIGALACQVVECFELDRYSLTRAPSAAQGEQAKNNSSRLYIARVVHVHLTHANSEHRPLIYHRQKFVSTTDTSLI